MWRRVFVLRRCAGLFRHGRRNVATVDAIPCIAWNMFTLKTFGGCKANARLHMCFAHHRNIDSGNHDCNRLSWS